MRAKVLFWTPLEFYGANFFGKCSLFLSAPRANFFEFSLSSLLCKMGPLFSDAREIFFAAISGARTNFLHLLEILTRVSTGVIIALPATRRNDGSPTMRGALLAEIAVSPAQSDFLPVS
jgi:hypothetical protein